MCVGVKDRTGQGQSHEKPHRMCLGHI
jgi:hypothetical protein